MNLLLLHGAVGAAGQMQPLAQVLAKQYTIHTLDFSGHGNAKNSHNIFSIELFANDVLRYMDDNSLAKASIIGYSMGGYVSMYLAKHHPERIDNIIAIATKYHWDEATAAKETKMLDAEKIEQKVPQFAKALQNRHTARGWKNVLQMTANMMTAMGTDNPLKESDYAAIPHKILIALGDRDKMVGLDETVGVYKALPNAQLCIMPNTAHPIEQLGVEWVGEMAKRFLGL